MVPILLLLPEYSLVSCQSKDQDPPGDVQWSDSNLLKNRDNCKKHFDMVSLKSLFGNMIGRVNYGLWKRYYVSSRELLFHILNITQSFLTKDTRWVRSIAAYPGSMSEQRANFSIFVGLTDLDLPCCNSNLKWPNAQWQGEPLMYNIIGAVQIILNKG